MTVSRKAAAKAQGRLHGAPQPQRRRAPQTRTVGDGSSTRKRPVTRTRAQTGRKRSLRVSPIFAAICGAIILFLIGVHFHGSSNSTTVRPPITAPFRYTLVAGDTSAGVASLFATDASVIEAQTGSSVPTPGLQITVDAALLWRRMSSAPFAANESLVESRAREVGIAPSLALAVAWQESRLQQEARSSTGAMGIMQVEPDTVSLASRDLGVPLDGTVPSDNVRAGLFWLHSLLVSYNNDQASALAAYYEGPGNLARRGYVSGTAEYVSRAQQVQRALLQANPGLAGG